jgi:hypothetical protein
MKDFFFTFGQRYRHEPHPQNGHPDGWFRISAPDYDVAREKMFAICGPYWCAQKEEEPSKDLYPLGELKHFVV